MDARSKAPAHKAEFTSAVKLRERIKMQLVELTKKFL
ncbi:bacteriocin, partial [Campylobacter coli]|nr:bacteriocin [Campylobacter coli]EAL2890592.1 bacteriocin [Campylobacter coli]